LCPTIDGIRRRERERRGWKKDLSEEVVGDCRDFIGHVGRADSKNDRPDTVSQLIEAEDEYNNRIPEDSVGVKPGSELCHAE
jgi:uncharacterized protein CbrC (UPF0167 family)